MNRRNNNVPSATYYFLAIIFLMSGVNNFVNDKVREGIICLVVTAIYLLLIFLLKNRRQ